MVHIFDTVAKFNSSDEAYSSHVIQGPVEGFGHEDKEKGRERAALSKTARGLKEGCRPAIYEGGDPRARNTRFD